MRNRTTTQPLNRLPLEIWQDIFLHACADGGYTGHSLALVSTFFHDASQSARFHSLAFTSLRQIEGFLAYTASTTTSLSKEPKVHHLLLSFSHSPSRESSSESSRTDAVYAANPPVADAWYQARRAREQEKAAWDREFAVVLPTLLDLVGPHLETLALLQSDAFIIPPIRHRLPRLRQLTLLMGITVILNEDLPDTRQASGSSPSASGASYAPVHLAVEAAEPSDAMLATRSLGHPEDAVARFPALERLHIICGRHRDWTLRDALVHLPRLAPRLTHLRISNATYTHGSHDCVAAFLRGALDIPRADGQGDAAALSHAPLFLDQPEMNVRVGPPAMPRLRRVEVHSIPPPLGAQCETSRKGYRMLAEAMKELWAACELTPDTRLYWTEGERAKHQVWEDACRAEWVDRIELGSGIWESFAVGKDRHG